jgi:hypothetical protein
VANRNSEDKVAGVFAEMEERFLVGWGVEELTGQEIEG